MLTHTATIKIGKPVDQVFEYVAKGYVENHPKWDAGCLRTEKTSDGPIGVGTRGARGAQRGAKRVDLRIRGDGFR